MQTQPLHGITDWSESGALCGTLGTITGLPTLFGRIELVSANTGIARLRRPTGEVGLIHYANFKQVKPGAGPGASVTTTTTRSRKTLLLEERYKDI